MQVKRPINLLYANTVTRHATTSPLPRKRKVRARVSDNTRKIGILDISARAGLLFELLEIVSRRQHSFTFYPVETSVPMGIGTIGETWWDDMRRAGVNAPSEREDLRLNIAVQEYFPFLRLTREAVGVDIIAGLFEPMLAFSQMQSDRKEFHWNYFSLGEDDEVAISVHGLRDYAAAAGRPFEAAVALLTLAQIWSSLFNVKFHKESRGCIFDFCRDRDDLVDVIREARLCPQSLTDIPQIERDDVEKCLQAIREYQR